MNTRRAEELKNPRWFDTYQGPQQGYTVDQFRALDASHQRLMTLLAESQHSIGGDWRDRRDAALESAQALSNRVKS